MLQIDEFHALICDNSNPNSLRFLVLSDNRLPVIEWDGYLSKETNEMCKQVADGIKADFDLIFLRTECEYQYRPDRLWFMPGLLIFEIHDSENPDPPDRHKWVPQENADMVKVHPRTESVIRYLKEFKESGLEINRERVHPFSRSGWFGEASNWLRKALTEAGHEIKSVTQFTSGVEASILIAESGSESKFYMKALPMRAFHDEITASCSLAAAMPEIFPKPLLVDQERKWIIMNDYGPALSATECSMEENPHLVKKVLCEWAKVQKKSIPIVGELAKSGIILQDHNRYKEMVKEMLNDSVYMDAQWETMTEEEKAKYGKEGYKKEFYEYVERLCERISQYKVPLTLVHGDLNPVNVIPNRGEGFTFIDYAYTCISFPFLDALSFWTVSGEDDESLDFYLELWTEFESMERLRDLLDLVRELSLVESSVLSLRFYEKADAGLVRFARTELSSPPCSRFSRHK